MALYLFHSVDIDLLPPPGHIRVARRIPLETGLRAEHFDFGTGDADSLRGLDNTSMLLET